MRLPWVCVVLFFLEMVVSFTSWAGELGEGKGRRRIHPRRGRKKIPPAGKIQILVLLLTPENVVIVVVVVVVECCCILINIIVVPLDSRRLAFTSCFL